MGFRAAYRFALAAALLGPSAAFASSGGITGVSGSPGDGFATCSGCHAGGAQTGNIAINGSGTVAPGSFTGYSVSLTSSNATTAGYNLSATAGTLSASTNSQASGGQVTHTSDLAPPVTWFFNWTAPGSVGTQTMYVCVNRVNNDSATTGDSPICTSRSITVNTSPNAVNDSAGVLEGSLNTCISVLSNDTSGASGNESGDSISLFSVGAPNQGGSAAIGGGACTASQVRYSPATNFFGTESFSYTIRDAFNSASFQDTATVTVTVTAVNDAPTLNAIGNASISEDPGLQTVNLAGISAGPGESQVLGVTASSNNTAVIPNPAVTYTSPNATGSISYTPVANASGSATVTVTVTDNGGTANGGVNTFSRNFTVTVNAVNDAPNAVGDSPGIAKNSTGNTIDVLANDTDVDNATLTITNVTTPSAGGSVIIQGVAPNQSLSYSPATNFSGVETFDYTISDGLLTDTATVTVTVSNGSAPTPLADAPAAVLEDSSGNLFDVLANDGDPDPGDTLEVILVNGQGSFPVATTHGSVSLSASGPGNALLYTPVADYAGADSFTYTVEDAAGLTAQATVSVTVANVNDAPVAAADGQGVAEDAAPVTLDVLANDTDADQTGGPGDTRQIVSVGATSAGGQVSIVGGGVNNTLSYDSAPDFFGTETFSYTMQDSTGLQSSATVTMTVNAVNDAPQITSAAVTTGADGQAYSYQVGVSDVDDLNNGAQLAWSLPTAPAGMTVSSTGLIQWTPPVNVVAGYDVTVQVADGGENGAAPATQSFTINVSVPDSDSDGMPDSFENQYGFDPNDASDADADADGDGDTNLVEYQNGSDPTLDDIKPVVTAPADLVVPATGYFTVVDLGTATAIDGKDGAVAVASDWTFPVVRPGRYVVTWSARDAAGNPGTDTQNVDVLPLATIGVDETVDGNGGTASLTIRLNGDAPEYPVTIDYSVDGNLGLTGGTATIVAGTFFQSGVTFFNSSDGTATYRLTSANGAVIGARDTQTVTVTNGNIPPVVAVDVQQNGVRTTVFRDQGPVSFIAFTSDPNPGDTLTYDWSGTAPELMPPAGNVGSYFVDAALVPPGSYEVRLDVSDSGGATTTKRVLVTVLDVMPTLTTDDTDGDGTDDVTEGFNDLDYDGVPDYLDAYPLAPFLHNQTGDLASALLLEADPQLTLRMGRTALAASRSGALISMADIVAFGVGGGGLPLGADSYNNVGGIFDFEVHGLSPGDTAHIVLPLQTSIREGAMYRKFDPATGWQGFVVDANNAVASANSAFGQCPGPASTDYMDGLAPFADCVRLTLEDGGPNDADGVADGVIRDPGGVAVTVDQGGATVKVSSGAWLALWLPLAALLRLRRRAGAVLLALAALCVALPAQADHHIRVFYTGDAATGFDDNVTNAQHGADIRESGFASVNGNVDYARALSLYTTLLLRGSGQYEYWNSFDGLNNLKATGMARLLYRGDGDFFTPTYAAWLSAAALEYDSDIRDGVEYRAGGFISENLTTQITGRFALGLNHREAAGRVFDLDGFSASVNFDWVPAPHMTVYTGFQYYDGGVASTATPSLWIGLAAEAIEADDAFGGLAGGLRAYRLDAQANILTLGYNYAFSRKLSADLQGQFISTRADAHNEYQRMVGVVSLLARF